MNRNLIAGGGALLLVALTACGGTGTKSVDATSSSETTTATAATTSPTTPSETTSASSSTTQPVQRANPLSAKSWQLSLKIKSKECFGSAGCSVEFTPRLKWMGPGPKPEEDSSYDITYEVKGPEDGAITGTISTHGTHYDDDTTYVSTSNSRVKLTVKITQIEDNNS